jgi:hypothetical protein
MEVVNDVAAMFEDNQKRGGEERSLCVVDCDVDGEQADIHCFRDSEGKQQYENDLMVVCCADAFTDSIMYGSSVDVFEVLQAQSSVKQLHSLRFSVHVSFGSPMSTFLPRPASLGSYINCIAVVGSNIDDCAPDVKNCLGP